MLLMTGYIRNNRGQALVEFALMLPVLMLLIIGMMEFGWADARVAVAEMAVDEVGWVLIQFDPETDQVGETVSRVITALQEALK